MKWLLLMIFVSLAIVTGCDRGVEPFHAGENPQTSQTAKTSPSPATSDSHGAGSEALAGQIPDGAVLFLIARIDADGNAMTRTPGDLQANSETPYDPGARGITLLINEAL
jgi:hypothetical protein